MNSRRAASALLTVGLHGGLVLALMWALRSPERLPTQSSISVSLVMEQTRPPSPIEHMTATAPRINAPNTPAMEVPLIALAAPAAGPAPTPSPAATPAPITTAAVAPAPAIAPAPAPEPQYQAALPPSRQCTEQTVARHYPPLLRERGVEGRVLLRVRVDELGRAAEVLVSRGSGWRLLDEAAQRLTQDCRFVPAHRGGQALVSWVEYPVSFALN